MITEEKFKEALSIVRCYIKQQQDLINEALNVKLVIPDKMTPFVSIYHVLSNKKFIISIRLVNALKSYAKHLIKYDFEYNNRTEEEVLRSFNINEIDYKELMRYRGIGRKTVIELEEIINEAKRIQL